MKKIILTSGILATSLFLNGFSAKVVRTDPTTSAVSLLSFDAIQNGHKIDFKWVTNSIDNAASFVIEKSKDGKLFEEVLKIQGSSHCYPSMEYFDTDYSPSEGKSFYRLKHVNGQNIEAVYNTVVVSYFPLVQEINLKQDHSSEDLSVVLKGFEGKEVLVVLRDMKGNDYFSKMFLTATNHSIIALDAESKIPAGSYVITASANNKIYSKKVIVR